MVVRFGVPFSESFGETDRQDAPCKQRLFNLFVVGPPAAVAAAAVRFVRAETFV